MGNLPQWLALVHAMDALVVAEGTQATDSESILDSGSSSRKGPIPLSARRCALELDKGHRTPQAMNETGETGFVKIHRLGGTVVTI